MGRLSEILRDSPGITWLPTLAEECLHTDAQESEPDVPRLS